MTPFLFSHDCVGCLCCHAQGVTSWFVFYLIKAKGVEDAAQVRAGPCIDACTCAHATPASLCTCCLDTQLKKLRCPQAASLGFCLSTQT